MQCQQSFVFVFLIFLDTTEVLPEIDQACGICFARNGSTLGRSVIFASAYMSADLLQRVWLFCVAKWRVTLVPRF